MRINKGTFTVSFLWTAIFLSGLLVLSCNSTKKVTTQESETLEQNSESEGVNELNQDTQATSIDTDELSDNPIEQNGVLGSDGTIAESVPRVNNKATTQNTEDIAIESSKNDQSLQNSEDLTDVNNSTEKKTESKKKETKEEKAARKEAEKNLKQEKKDNYTGWVYTPKKNFEVTNGDLKLNLRGKIGSFEIYAIPEVGKPIPLLSTFDEFCSTFFSLMIGRKEYRLNREAGVKSEARKTQYGAQLAYTIAAKAQIVVDLSFMPSIATSSKVDMLRVTIYTINLGKSTQSFTVKGVFDTMLGENSVTHFSTAAHSRINSSVQYTDMSQEKWICSENEKASIQFILNGKGITNPKAVTLANKDDLSGLTWLPSIAENRSFSSVQTYNNSAIGINWKTAYLDPMKTDVITFYISVATDGNEPAGKEFLSSLSSGRTALPSNLPNTIQLTRVAAEPVEIPTELTASTYYENMPAISGESTVRSSVDEITSVYSGDIPSQTPVQSSAVKEIIPEQIQPQTYMPVKEEPTPDKQVYSEPIQNKQATVQPVSKAQLDPEYIQDLLDRISELENDSSLIDKAEIKRLNDELDRILTVLGSMN